MADRLRPEILNHLTKKTGNSEGGIRVRLSLLKRKFKGITLNAAAQVFAEEHGFSIMPKISSEDKKTLKDAQPLMVPKREVVIHGKKSIKPFKIFFNFATTNKFEVEHISEINKAYNAGCYTATYILSRKVIENLIIKLLKKRFPKNMDLYFDTTRGRFRDFSEIIINLSRNKKQFDPTVHKAIERLVTKVNTFRDDANNNTHSLFHLATKNELDAAEIDYIIALIESIDATIN